MEHTPDHPTTTVQREDDWYVFCYRCQRDIEVFTPPAGPMTPGGDLMDPSLMTDQMIAERDRVMIPGTRRPRTTAGRELHDGHHVDLGKPCGTLGCVFLGFILQIEDEAGVPPMTDSKAVPLTPEAWVKFVAPLYHLSNHGKGSFNDCPNFVCSDARKLLDAARSVVPDRELREGLREALAVALHDLYDGGEDGEPYYGDADTILRHPKVRSALATPDTAVPLTDAEESWEQGLETEIRSVQAAARADLAARLAAEEER